MAIQQFNRGLSDDFVDVLNDEYKKGGWWRNLVDDPETFLAIREDYVNVYYRGCSLLKLECNEHSLCGSVHYKYLVRPELEHNEYIKVVGGKPDLEEHRGLVFMETLANAEDLKKAAEPYADTEKTGVHDIIHKNRNVLDVEINIRNSGKDHRIDLAALHKIEGGVEIRFYEAKHFSNGYLRAGNGTPKVIKQISDYSRALGEHRTDIENSYLTVCRNLSKLAGIDKRHPERHEMLKSIADDPTHRLRIDTAPRLLVFGFDADQKEGRTWKLHRDKLCIELRNRVKMRGKAEDLAPLS